MGKLTEYMISMMPLKYKPQFKLIRDRSDEFGYLVHYRHLKFLTRQRMIIHHVNKVNKFKQKPWLEPNITLITVKRAATEKKLN